MFDLAPAAQELSRLVSGVRDDQLGHPTPCPEWTVAELLAHVHQFASAFSDNAQKRQARPPQVLVDDWRVVIPDQLDELARPGAKTPPGRAGYRPEASRWTRRPMPWSRSRS